MSRFKGLPSEALRAAADDRAFLAPRFIRIIEDYLGLPADELTPFGDSITELSCWAGFRKEDPEGERRGRDAALPRGIGGALRQPARSIKLGRNESYPCMSGKNTRSAAGRHHSETGFTL